MTAYHAGSGVDTKLGDASTEIGHAACLTHLGRGWVSQGVGASTGGHAGGREHGPGGGGGVASVPAGDSRYSRGWCVDSGLGAE
jgi:hypothetical protein